MTRAAHTNTQTAREPSFDPQFLQSQMYFVGKGVKVHTDRITGYPVLVATQKIRTNQIVIMRRRGYASWNIKVSSSRFNTVAEEKLVGGKRTGKFHVEVIRAWRLIQPGEEIMIRHADAHARNCYGSFYYEAAADMFAHRHSVDNSSAACMFDDYYHTLWNHQSYCD
mmetsp:Transcript_9308/g.12806  ORF Transcript_9308/g.12806 Transcript_9308/m.12806 type:complete len:167 (+) Transcript_9308:485-985(+)|eukprot:CAMPEP_0185262732 /NCGR_PEP_ID=MMETSP1359-20130426/10795_1 /TAXON_ID=552665 /ORGANISM="Bigelowiella longifila, Strain CCMP242" /LENGTH=166 /DNA_ID=CAMNT_0027849763 /DNA_START=566 /DNA_END=1066 /DNA_ORIENTATION=+